MRRALVNLCGVSWVCGQSGDRVSKNDNSYHIFRIVQTCSLKSTVMHCASCEVWWSSNCWMIQIFNLDKMFITFLSIIFISCSASPNELKHPRCVRQARQPRKKMILDYSYAVGVLALHSKSGYFSVILNGPDRTQWFSLWLICVFLVRFLSYCSNTGPLSDV